jgi:hypothetical protein
MDTVRYSFQLYCIDIYDLTDTSYTSAQAVIKLADLRLPFLLISYPISPLELL